MLTGCDFRRARYPRGVCDHALLRDPVGNWIHTRGVRDEIEVHTKVSSDHSSTGIRTALDRSLDRLQTSYVDGYYLHSPPTNPAESVSALAEERKAGRARRIGICNASVDKIAAAHRIAPLDLCQNIYDLARPDAALDLLPWCVAHRVAFVVESVGRWFPFRQMAPAASYLRKVLASMWSPVTETFISDRSVSPRSIV